MDPIQELFKSGQLSTNNFPVTSRYHFTETKMFEGLNDEPVVYLKRRFIPHPDYYYSTQQHLVKQGERLDNVTAKYLVDPEQFWQIADANLAMKAQELTEFTGRYLRIPQSTGISGF